jgi:hypothetical protein
MTERTSRCGRWWITVAATLGLLAASCGGDGSRRLTATDVTGLPPGDASGTSFAGHYLITAGKIEDCACSRPDNYCSTARVNVGRTIAVTQNGGSMTAVFDMVPDLLYAGGVNADGTYRLGAAIDKPGTLEYLAMQGHIRSSAGGAPTGMDTTQELFAETTDFACEIVKGSFSSDYLGTGQ